MTGVELTVVIPIRNEAPSLVEQHRELTDTLTAWGRSYEIVVVDENFGVRITDVVARTQRLSPSGR